MKRPGFRGVFEAVRDAIARRTDTRPRAAEPIEAFGRELDGLGHGRFGIWWARTVSELRLADPGQVPTTVCVLSAALAEAALIFVVKRARDLNLGTMNSATFKSESPRQWKFEDVLKSAAAGGDDAILDVKTRERADRLNYTRQRIHAGRLMADVPQGSIPDIRPEEARDARETLDALLRRVVDWIMAHPAVPRQ